MSDPIILPVKTGEISEPDKEKLDAAGIIVIETENPEDLKLIRATVPFDNSDAFYSALKAISGDSMGYAQQRFCKFLLGCLDQTED